MNEQRKKNTKKAEILLIIALILSFLSLIVLLVSTFNSNNRNDDDTAVSKAPTSEQETIKPYDYTQEDVHILGDLMYAGTEGKLEGVSKEDTEKAMKLWGQVALNWANEFGTTIKEIINTHVYDEVTKQKIGNIDTPEEVYKWAEELLECGSYAPSNLLHSFYFPMDTVKYDEWEEYAHIGSIYFYLH